MLRKNLRKESGTFDLISAVQGWKHESHKGGKIADVRYFNNTPADANFYDLNEGTERANDIQKYLYFLWDMENVSHMPSGSRIQPITRKDQIFNTCLQNPTIPPCILVVQASDLTYSKILDICKFYPSGTSMNPVPAAGCSDNGYFDAMKRYSVWATSNITNLAALKPTFKFIIGDGRYSPVDPLHPTTWQRQALTDGIWPNGDRILKTTGGILLNEEISLCNGQSCTYNQIVNIRAHLSHIHLILK